jgi:hypothetical protein
MLRKSEGIPLSSAAKHALGCFKRGPPLSAYKGAIFGYRYGPIRFGPFRSLVLCLVIGLGPGGRFEPGEGDSQLFGEQVLQGFNPITLDQSLLLVIAHAILLV